MIPSRTFIPYYLQCATCEKTGPEAAQAFEYKNFVDVVGMVYQSFILTTRSTLDSIPEFLGENEGGTLREWWRTIDADAGRPAPWDPNYPVAWDSELLNRLIQQQVRLRVDSTTRHVGMCSSPPPAISHAENAHPTNRDVQ